MTDKKYQSYLLMRPYIIWRKEEKKRKFDMFFSHHFGMPWKVSLTIFAALQTQPALIYSKLKKETAQ